MEVEEGGEEPDLLKCKPVDRILVTERRKGGTRFTYLKW